MKRKFIKGKWTLTHDRFIDSMGFEKDSFDLFNSESRTHFPFLGKLKISEKGGNFPINRIPYEYNQSDYAEMMEEQVKKIESGRIKE